MKVFEVLRLVEIESWVAWVLAVILIAIAIRVLYLVVEIFTFGLMASRAPAIGEMWLFRDHLNKDPFKEYLPVKILDVRDGFVQYEFEYGTRSSCKLDLFMRMYRPV